MRQTSANWFGVSRVSFYKTATVTSLWVFDSLHNFSASTNPNVIYFWFPDSLEKHSVKKITDEGRKPWKLEKSKAKLTQIHQSESHNIETSWGGKAGSVAAQCKVMMSRWLGEFQFFSLSKKRCGKTGKHSSFEPRLSVRAIMVKLLLITQKRAYYWHQIEQWIFRLEKSLKLFTVRSWITFYISLADTTTV